MSFREICHSPVAAMQGLSDDAGALLEEIGVVTVGDLAAWNYCRRAEAIVTVAKYCDTKNDWVEEMDARRDTKRDRNSMDSEMSSSVAPTPVPATRRRSKRRAPSFDDEEFVSSSSMRSTRSRTRAVKEKSEKSPTKSGGSVRLEAPQTPTTSTSSSDVKDSTRKK